MAFNRKVEGAHIIEILKELYGFNFPPTEDRPGVPRNVDGWEGIAEGTVNGNYLVEMLMPRGDAPDNGNRRLVITFLEDGGVDAVPRQDIDFYMSLLSHIRHNCLSINDDDGRQVRFRVPAPYRANSEHPDKLGPLWVDYTYTPLDNDISMTEYRRMRESGEYATETKPIIVSPFINGAPASHALDGQEPKMFLKGKTVDEFWENGRSHREPQNPDFFPLKVCYSFGRALAAFHLAAMDFPGEKKENRMGVDKWLDILSGVEEHAQKVDKHVGKEGFVKDRLSHHIHALVEQWEKDAKGLPKGFIHGDPFPDNVLMTGIANHLGKMDKKVRGTIDVGIIDPWAACYDTLLLDIGIVLGSWATTKDGKIIPENAKAFLAGYDKVRQRSPEEIRLTSLAAEVGSARFALTRANMRIDLDPDMTIKLRDPSEMLDRANNFKRLEMAHPNALEPNTVSLRNGR